MTRDKRSSELERHDARDPLDPFFEGIGPAIGKLTRVSAELEAGTLAASLPRGAATPGRGPSVTEAYRMAMLTGPAAGGDSEGHDSLPGESAARSVLSALQLSQISRGRLAVPVLSAAIERTFGVRDDVPVETGTAPPSGSGGSRGYAINGRAYVATAEPDLTVMADRQVIGHEFAHALQQRRGTGLAATGSTPTRAPRSRPRPWRRATRSRPASASRCRVARPTKSRSTMTSASKSPISPCSATS